ncbi:MAG: FlgD immunoglobulin-like domain containing protein [Candidatus Eisenbacteria bacterium]|nr:FlgD immunoglobulin-like domain containing protein [Candidatus Eisenbacteria bacterium]
MKRTCIGLLLLMTVLCGAATAEVSFDFICVGYAWDITPDGTVVVGNAAGTYETFRWTALDGVELLGGSTAAMGSGAGTPDVSADGAHASATIADVATDSTYITQGLWTQGERWTETMPPTPPDGGTMDGAYGSAWGLSDDASTLVGLYWRPGQPDGSAHASYWTEETGVVDLGSSGRNSRANDADYDGNVIVGWDENPDWGGWRPTVWVDGVMTVLESPEGFCLLYAVTPDGGMVIGNSYNEDRRFAEAAKWEWTGSTWDKHVLGSLPGTFADYGNVQPHDVTADGSMIVGSNGFDWTQYAAFIWTEETGMVNLDDFLVDNGVTLPPMFDIQSLTAISDDGTVMVGFGQDTYYPWGPRSFIIDTNATGIEDVADVGAPKLHMSAFPNPACGGTTLSFSLASRENVRLSVYDITGRLVAEIDAGSMDAGRHGIPWDGRDGSGADVASGIYLCRLDAGGQHTTEKVTVLR